MTLVAAALALAAGGGWAQTVHQLELIGRVVHVRGADRTPLAGATVVLHRIAARTGPIDSARTRADGRFRFRVASSEPGAVYLVSVRFQGIGYFSPPVPADSARPAPIAVAVYDTASSGRPLAVTMRHVIVSGAGGDGNRSVLDIIEVENLDPRTRIGRDSSAAVWTMRLPREVAAPQAGEGEIAPTAVRFDNGRILVSAPFPPGTKEVVATYVLPGDRRRLALPIDQPTGRLEVLTEDSAAITPDGLRAAPPFVMEGRSFRRFVADSLAAGAEPSLRFGGAPRALGGRRWSWLVVVAAAAALAAGASLSLRRSFAPPPRAPGEAGASREALLAQIVALDERYAGREATTGPEEWRAYRERRERLKRELARHVARG